MAEIVGHDSPGDLPEPKDPLTPDQRIAAFQAAIKKASDKYRCHLVPYRDEKPVGEGETEYLTTLRIGVRPLKDEP